MMKYAVNKTRCAKFVLACLVVVQIAACGGGGGGSSGVSASPTVLSTQGTSAPTATTSTTSDAVAAPSTFTINGAVVGLNNGATVGLSDNGTDGLSVTSNGGFSFTNPVASNGSYLVTITQQPNGQFCTVSNGTGSGVVANISNIKVTCSTNTYSVSGSVTGLTTGQQVTLLNNGDNLQTINANGAYTLNVPVAYNSSYAVTVGTQPAGQICSISNAAGSGVVANVTQVNVTCSAITYTISGGINGLASGQQVTLLNNGADPLTVLLGTDFSFDVPVAYNGSYSVTVGTQPIGQICTVSNGAGAGVVANIVNVSVNCSALTYTIGGSISGLNPGQQVTLLNSGSDAATVNANGAFTFSVPVAFHSGYAVTVSTQPNGQVCTVSSGSGSGVVGDVSNVNVHCSTNTYIVSGSVTGLAPGLQVTLLNNGANAQTVTSNTGFAFSTPVAFGSSDVVTVGTQPVGQTCTVTNGSISSMSGNVNNVSVSCVQNSPETPPPCIVNSTASNLVITTPSCSGGTQGGAYSGCTIAASGGTPPYSYCVSTSGTNPPLPEGMALNSSTGAISSAQIAGQGYYGTKIVVFDSANNSASKVIYFSINGNNAYLANIFPADSIFHHRVDAATTSLPVDTSPAAPIKAAYQALPFQHFFGNQYSTPWPYGTPTIQVPATQAMVPVSTLLYHADFTSAPIPSYAPVEDTLYSTGDRHVIVYVQAGTSAGAALYEMWQGVYTNTNNTGSWTDGSNALWTNVATSNTLPAQGAGTTNAAGLADGPLLITADEVIGSGTASAPAGAIKHTIRMTLPTTLDNWVWPGTASAGTGSCTGISTYSLLSQSSPPSACTATSPSGQIYRLKAGATLPSCVATSPQTAIIITAMQNYGVIIGDNGTAGQLIGTPDARWNDSDLNCLNNLTLASLEPVNVSSLMITATSGQTSH